jgi:F-type H+-transporting ATPase subunit b
MQLFFAEAASNGNLLTSLGLDARLFIVQTLAFAVLLGVLAKFAYPPLIKSIDDRRAKIEAGLKEAEKSHQALEEAEANVQALLAEARKEADGIIARSQQEASAMVAEAETKAKQRAERLVAEARSQLDADVSKAREALKKDTLKLVSMATEKIISEKLDANKDAKLVEAALNGERA